MAGVRSCWHCFDSPPESETRQEAVLPRSADLRASPGGFGTVRVVDDRDELSRRLWTLRELMSQLLCALEVQQLVLTNQRLRWLPMISANVEKVVDEIRHAEAERILVSQRVARSYRLRDDASLAELAHVAEEPHAEIWRQSRLHLLAIQSEIDAFAQENQELNRRGMGSTVSVIRHLHGESSETYDPHGATERLAPATSRFDRTG